MSDVRGKATMTDTNIKVRKHCSAVGLTDRIKAAVVTVTRAISSPWGLAPAAEPGATTLRLIKTTF